LLTWIAVSQLGNQVFSQTPPRKVTLSYSSSGITSIECFVLWWGESETDLGREKLGDRGKVNESQPDSENVVGDRRGVYLRLA
jgi:hypothetical protein